MFFGVGVSCRKLFSFIVYLYVDGSGSITSFGEERADLSADGQDSPKWRHSPHWVILPYNSMYFGMMS